MEAIKFELITNKFNEKRPNAQITYSSRGKEATWVLGTDRAKAFLENLDTMKAMCDAYTGRTAFKYLLTVNGKEWKVSRSAVELGTTFKAELTTYVEKYWTPRVVTLVAEPCTMDREKGVEFDMTFLLPCYEATEEQIAAYGLTDESGLAIPNQKVAWGIGSWELKFFLDDAFKGELLEKAQEFLDTEAEKLVIPFTTKAGERKDKEMNRHQAEAFVKYSNWLLKASRNPEKYLIE